MRTLWVGIVEDEVLCNGDDASDIVRRMREGELFPISEKLDIRAVTDHGKVCGFGLVVVQTSDVSAVFSLKSHEQYLWLMEGWFESHGITGERGVSFFIENIDAVPDAPEQWK